MEIFYSGKLKCRSSTEYCSYGVTHATEIYVALVECELDTAHSRTLICSIKKKIILGFFLKMGMVHGKKGKELVSLQLMTEFLSVVRVI